jgi:hypothetical protein
MNERLADIWDDYAVKQEMERDLGDNEPEENDEDEEHEGRQRSGPHRARPS